MTNLKAILEAFAQAFAAAASAAALDTHDRLPASEDRWLTPAEAAQQMGVTVRWLSRRWRRLPFCHPLPGGARGFRVSAAALQRSMQQRR
jgi:hypothetical protein